MLAASALRAYAPLRSCPHFVSECVRYARGKFIVLASPTAVRGYLSHVQQAARAFGNCKKTTPKIMETKERSSEKVHLGKKSDKIAARVMRLLEGLAL